MFCAKPLNVILYALEGYPVAEQSRIENISLIADLVSYNQLGTTIFDDTYIRTPYGPVSSYASVKMNIPENTGDSGENFAGSTVVPQKESLLSKFSIYEYYVLKKVLSKVDQMEDGELSGYADSFGICSDTDIDCKIPLRKFYLGSSGSEKLKCFGFSNITDEQEFTRAINIFSKEVSRMGRPDKVLINWKLDEIRERFPEGSKDLFYDVYLAWDEAFRLLIKDYHIFADVLGRQFCENYCIVTNECGSSDYSDLIKCAGEDYHFKIKEIYNFLTDEDKFSSDGKSSDKAFIELMKSCNNSLNRKYLKKSVFSGDNITL